MTPEWSDTNYETETATGDVAVVFHAPWCSPCRLILPSVDHLEERLRGVVKIGRINADSNEASQQRFDVKSIPTIVLLRDGQEVGRKVGVNMPTKEELRKSIGPTEIMVDLMVRAFGEKVTRALQPRSPR